LTLPVERYKNIQHNYIVSVLIYQLFLIILGSSG